MTELRGVAAFPRGERLKRRQAFQAVFQRGSRVERPSVVVLWRRWNGPRQVGFAVSRQVQGAVKRNRVRRRLREAYRRCRLSLPDGVQLVCLGREAAVEGRFIEIQLDVEAALNIVASQKGSARR
jgi:ribonuclease P protein component